MSRKPRVEKVRASRDGHEYHEAWVARMALQLLWPGCKLVAIAVEGLSPRDQTRASAATVEIADIALYYGHIPAFERASRTSIVQFKYSVADENTHFRASGAKQTIAKFAKTYREYRDKYGPEAVQEKLDFELITNRPIYNPLLEAIDALAKGLRRTGEVERQSLQFKVASGLEGEALEAFAAKCNFVGGSSSLPATKRDLARLLVDWSATSDSLATARLGQLRQIVREKAGQAGACRNLIKRTDVLAALGIAEAADLLPCPASTSDVGKVVEREQLGDAMAIVAELSRPLLIHGAGGVGKTVFIESLASTLREQREIVFFDCFGGGAYRSPEDARHLPNKGLIHIANTLAFRGLCDPILPEGTGAELLMRTFRRRLVQSVSTLKRVSQRRELALFIDAIDNAELIARDRNQRSFPVLLLESLHDDPVSGVKLIVSCRTERKPSTYARFVDFELRPFSINETAAYLRPRVEKVSHIEISVAQARSGGNPRVLEYLVKTGRGLLDESEINKSIELDDLIQQRISDALATGLERGTKQEEIDAFLAGLAVLPPPVPLDEYAGAHGMQLSAVKSFAADLVPLLERTGQGLMFRDEPTETLVQKLYGSSEKALRRVASNLQARQAESVYAARALPGLLHRLNDAQQLFELAFDDRIPASITSTIGKRNVRCARVEAAALHAAVNRDYNRLVRLLLELSTIAAADQRGADYILNSPDLVVAAKDVDAKRRLFETRTGWPGTRRARLAIANSLAGDCEEASRHAFATNEWIDHYRRTDEQDRRDRPQPDQCDIAAIPFFLVCEGRARNAVNFLKGWKEWCAYEVCEYVFGYCQLASATRPSSAPTLAEFVDALTHVGPLAAVLSFQRPSPRAARNLIVKLSQACKRTAKLDLPDFYQRRRPHEIQDGLRKAAALALSLGSAREALTICDLAPHERPGIWSLRNDFYYSSDLFPFVFRTALFAASKRRAVHEKDVIPRELVSVCARISRKLTGEAFRAKVKQQLPRHASAERDERGAKKYPRLLSRGEKEEAERFVDRRLQPLLNLTRALARFLAAPARGVDDAFIELLETWEDVRKNRDPYQTRDFDNVFRMLGLDAALFALWTRDELQPASVERFLRVARGQHVATSALIQIVSILAQRGATEALAGEQAQKARTLIQAEDDVEHQASLFASLARAILPASIDDASVYFRDGLEQMDAIGSGDWEFTNELLLFASATKGAELDEQDFHTLTNICELNMGGEPEKFPWGAFARGLSKTAGPKGLAKLSRWDDRSKIDLSHTLLPYLTALVQDGKIQTDLALALNRLASPVEYWFDGTTEFARAIEGKDGTARRETVAELIRQFEDNNPGIPMEGTVEVLASLAERTFGKSSETAAYLSAAHERFAKVRTTTSAHMNYQGGAEVRMSVRADNGRGNEAGLKTITTATDPTDPVSLAKAIEALKDFGHNGDLKGRFFAVLRGRVAFNARARYVRNICELEGCDFYWKLAELKACKDSWGPSSAALGEVLRSEAMALTRLHSEDLVSDGRFSHYQLNEISSLTGVAVAELVLELIKVLARPDRPVSGAVWLAFASFICPMADEGQGQIALKRLLSSESAKLADSVTDGAWVDGLYPKGSVDAIAAGLVWRMLGSPYAEDRWRAAHSIRCFARFGRWNIVDALVARINERTAGPFQARELAFYHEHARLWLLIALARIAPDHHKEIVRYKAPLLSIATEAQKPHVLMRHFAARALLDCIDSGSLVIEVGAVKDLRAVDLSPHPRLKGEITNGADFYHGRPDPAPKPKREFHLDLDFEKYEVDTLGRVFGKPPWQLADTIADMVHEIDPNASSMYDRGGRKSRYRDSSFGLSTRYHTYGQQLGWHALFLTAGQLLRNCWVTDDWHYHEDPWGEWLDRYLLTRADGRWLSDGTDRTPLDTTQAFLEKGKEGFGLTGDQDKLMQLIGVRSRVGKELVVQAHWRSADDITIGLSSALVPPKKARRLARGLMREDPMRVWIPIYRDSEDNSEYVRGGKVDCTPWIVCPSGEARLDQHDPFGLSYANFRPRLFRDLAAALSLTRKDPFGRYWQDRRGTVVLRAEAWGRDDYSERGPHPGTRLYCSGLLLRRILDKYDKNLLLLISLQRYEKEGNKAGGHFSRTVAAITVSKALQVEYFKGRVNHLQSSRN
jgi:NACHT domain